MAARTQLAAAAALSRATDRRQRRRRLRTEIPVRATRSTSVGPHLAQQDPSAAAPPPCGRLGAPCRAPSVTSLPRESQLQASSMTPSPVQPPCRLPQTFLLCLGLLPSFRHQISVIC